jgi:hypothetical protein
MKISAVFFQIFGHENPGSELDRIGIEPKKLDPDRYSA